MLRITNEFLDEVQVEQGKDQELQQIISELGIEKRTDFRMGKDNILRFREKVCVPGSRVLRKMLLDEGHKSLLSIHPGMTKMYKDLKATFWWTGIDEYHPTGLFSLGQWSGPFSFSLSLNK